MDNTLILYILYFILMMFPYVLAIILMTCHYIKNKS